MIAVSEYIFYALEFCYIRRCQSTKLLDEILLRNLKKKHLASRRFSWRLFTSVPLMPNLGSQRDHSPSSEIASPPRTPPDRNSLDKAHVLHRQNGTATPSFSPLASPSMSLPSLGMSPFTPSGRPVSPPFMGSSPSSRSRTPQLNQDDLPLGSKITLIQRLTDLAMKINQENRDEDKSLNKLHAMMDQMESVLSDHSHHQDAEVGDSGPSKSSPRVPSDNAVREPQAPEDAMHDGSNPVTPVKPSPSSKESHESKGEHQTHSERATKISGVDAERIVAEAQTLCKGLEAVVANLRARQEESDARLPPSFDFAPF